MSFSLDFRFYAVPRKDISLDSIKEYLDSNDTKRIHFATSHVDALKENSGKYTINLPFSDSIQAFLISELGETMSKLFPSKYDNRYYRILKSEEESEGYKNFIRKYQKIVFLRDNLDLSIALDMNFSGGDSLTRTEIGDLEYKAKYDKDTDALKSLIELVDSSLEWLPYLRSVDVVCAMPQKKGSEMKLPKLIVNSLKLQDSDIENISDKVWMDKKVDLKNCEDHDSKLCALRDSSFEIDKDVDLSDKTVLLIDDLYKSGVSMNYVAMKLKEAGAKRVFGLAIVKSLGNS